MIIRDLLNSSKATKKELNKLTQTERKLRLEKEGLIAQLELVSIDQNKLKQEVSRIELDVKKGR